MYIPNNKQTIVTIANRQEGNCEDRYDDDNENDGDDDDHDDHDDDSNDDDGDDDDDSDDDDDDELCLLSFLTARTTVLLDSQLMVLVNSK